MSFVKKTKEFFGLEEPFEGGMVQEDAYYEDRPRYEGNLAYGREPSYRSYEDYSQPSYSTAIVPAIIRSYSDATGIGEPFRDGDAVVFDLSSLSREDSKRIVDFAAGLCFALRGKMKKLDTAVFALVPEKATDVTTADLERAARIR